MELQKQNFVRTIEANQGLIRSLCRAYYSGTEDQKDAFQDIVLQLWKSIDTFRGESKISTWIYKVGLNTLLAKVRKDEKQISAEAISMSELTISNAMADDDSELLNLVIHSLTGWDKAIIILFLEGYKNKEIAQILNLTPTNISTRLSRIKAELKNKFDKHHHELTKS